MTNRAGINPLVLGWEKAAIGTGLYEPSAMDEAVDLLPADFTGCHQIIWAEMLNLRQRDSLDVRALSADLRIRLVDASMHSQAAGEPIGACTLGSAWAVLVWTG